jgi:hypothetical protein
MKRLPWITALLLMSVSGHSGCAGFLRAREKRHSAEDYQQRRA